MKFGPKTLAILSGLGQIIYGALQSIATKDYSGLTVGLTTGIGTIASAYSGPKQNNADTGAAAKRG